MVTRSGADGQADVPAPRAGNMILRPRQVQFVDPAETLGRGHPLVEQLGTASGLVALGPLAMALRIGPLTSLASLRRLLAVYQDDVLFSVELPAISRAYHHARQNQFRELLHFDRQLAAEPRWRGLVEPSRRIGRCQLRRLRPLRDVRFVQRYLGAVEREQAHAWHVLVYGLSMFLFSLPLHQGLHGYARQIIRGFIDAAAPTLRLSEGECRRLTEERCAPLSRLAAPWCPAT